MAFTHISLAVLTLVLASVMIATHRKQNLKSSIERRR